MYDVFTELRGRFDRHDWTPIVHGYSGAGVWRLDGSPDCYVKIAQLSGHPDGGFDPRAEAPRLEWLCKQGIPAPEVIEVGEREDVTWLITTAVPGRTAADPWPVDQRAGVVDALADVARALHALPVEDCPFDRSLAVTVPHARYAAAHDLVDLDELDDERLGWTNQQLVDQLESTRPSREELVVCHGDLCLPNVLFDPETLKVTGLIDIGRLGKADRYADLALATRSLGQESLNPQFGPSDVDRFLERYGENNVDTERIEFYRLLDEFF